MVFERNITETELGVLMTLEKFVRKAHAHSNSHDYAHILVVCRNAIKISRKVEEKVDPFVVMAAALLHDIGKTTNTFEHLHGLFGGSLAEEFLDGIKVDPAQTARITRCVIRHTSTSMIPPESVEEKIIWDADKLDGLGIMGLLRGFIGRQGSMDEILKIYLKKRGEIFDDLYFDASREIGRQKNRELEEASTVIETRLKTRLLSVERIFHAEGLVTEE